MRVVSTVDCPWCTGAGHTPCDVPWCSDDDHGAPCRYCDSTGGVQAIWTGDRWRVKAPVWSVPWVSGTVADLECWRRCGFSVGGGGYHPDCCRFPKSCSAFDPGFTTGKGPTTLPMVWNDGYSWRSGPPDPKTIPEHLFDDIWRRWRSFRRTLDNPTT